MQQENDGAASAPEKPERTVDAAFPDFGEGESGAASEAPLSKEQELQSALDEAQDKYVRVLAETENFKKRLARERVEERAYAAQEVVQALLPVVDNLERALGAAKAASGAEQAADSPLVQLEKGVELVLRQFEDALRKQGVNAVETPLGRPFDPNLHQPLVQQDAPDADDGAVLEVLQKGWRMGDRLLRPSMVKVARKP